MGNALKLAPFCKGNRMAGPLWASSRWFIGPLDRRVRAGSWAKTGPFQSLRIALIAMTTLVVSCSATPLPLGATVQSQPLHMMWVVFFWTGLGVGAVVYALIAWCILRYRRRRKDDDFPKQFRRNTVLEITYTIIPLVVVVALFAITLPAEQQAEALSTRQGMIVNVTAFRWSWLFNYPQFGVSVSGLPGAPPRFALPVGETIRFNLTSVDVDHSFWVPAFLFKRDAIPGLANSFDWTPTKVGVFRGACAEFCGLDHTAMSFQVDVMSGSDFKRWMHAHHANFTSAQL